MLLPYWLLEWRLEAALKNLLWLLERRVEKLLWGSIELRGLARCCPWHDKPGALLAHKRLSWEPLHPHVDMLLPTHQPGVHPHLTGSTWKRSFGRHFQCIIYHPANDQKHGHNTSHSPADHGPV